MEPFDFFNSFKHALAVLKLPSKSMSTTDLKAFGERFAKSHTKFPAAPAMTKSILPNFSTVFLTAFSTCSKLRTSTFAIAKTASLSFANCEIPFAACSVLSWSLPTIAALQPRRTKASVCTRHIVPAPPVTNATLPLNKSGLQEPSVTNLPSKVFAVFIVSMTRTYDLPNSKSVNIRNYELLFKFRLSLIWSLTLIPILFGKLQ
ncbi:EC1118_1N9_1431p [Saccharomyces cerevisiae EC1118]|uniref:EC1118_1N9_1431p n=2 Tax=Saccharomyces cerevisiae TaxID=4932 RepID=C8ZG28_YEAS8|nr:hypothetical protein AWRI1631_141280 [Saccharomyces cerevisiae AWRI1631]CAY82401.1 EC1118_1N9_1431p [Saccharomyces cerevisiae EC1118]